MKKVKQRLMPALIVLLELIVIYILQAFCLKIKGPELTVFMLTVSVLTFAALFFLFIRFTKEVK